MMPLTLVNSSGHIEDEETSSALRTDSKRATKSLKAAPGWVFVKVGSAALRPAQEFGCLVLECPFVVSTLCKSDSKGWFLEAGHGQQIRKESLTEMRVQSAPRVLASAICRVHRAHTLQARRNIWTRSSMGSNTQELPLGLLAGVASWVGIHVHLAFFWLAFRTLTF